MLTLLSAKESLLLLSSLLSEESICIHAISMLKMYIYIYIIYTETLTVTFVPVSEWILFSIG